MTAGPFEHERARVQQIAPVYHSELVAGANAQYHLHRRDAVIPAAGGTIGAGTRAVPRS